MKKLIVGVTIVATWLFAVPSTQALLVGQLDGSEPDAFLFDAVDVHPSLSRVNGLDLVDLDTKVATKGSVDEYGDWFYYTNAAGFWKKNMNTGTRRLIKAGSKLDLADMVNRWAVVSDAGSGNSFIYSAATGSIIPFTPRVKEIISASLTARGGFDPRNMKVAMIAKNMAGRQRLFISNGRPWTLAELPLPRYATSCDGVAMSPQNNYLYIDCTFNIPGQGNSLKGYVLADLDYVRLSSVKRIITNKTVSDVEWVRSNHLVTIETDGDGLTTMVDRTLDQGRVVSSEIIGVDSITDVGGREALLTPFDVEPISGPDLPIYYTMITQFTDGNAPFIGPTVLGRYRLATQVDELLSNDGTFKYFPN